MTLETTDPIARGWMIVRGVEASARRELATKIYCSVNLNEVYSREKKTFVVRADTIKDVNTTVSLVVPITAENDDKLRQIADDLADEFDIPEYELAIVEDHVPFPPHNAPGYVTADEANPLKEGATGHNPW